MQCEYIVFQTMRFIHCADNNNIDAYDITWKLRNLMEKVKSVVMKCLFLIKT